MNLINIAQAGIINDAPRVSNVLYNAFQFLLSVFGFLAIIGIVISGVMYITALGDEQQIKRAKKAFWSSVVGIIVALGGWVIIKNIGVLFS
jgi:hypothetical protein